MTIYTVITALCFAAITAGLLYVIIKLFLYDRPGRISFIRGFKKGKCVFAYIFAMPLYFIGHIYAGMPFADAFFGTVNKIINLVLLRFDYSSVTALMEANLLYKITVYYSQTVVLLNAIVFALSLTSQRIWLFFYGVAAYFTRKPRLVLFGYNEENLAVAKSDKTSVITLIDKISPQDCENLYSMKIGYISVRDAAKQIPKLFKRTDRGKQFTIIINTGDDRKNISLCRAFIEGIAARNGQNKEVFGKLRIYVFGDPRFENLYGEVVSSSFGCIQYVNKYGKVAMEFIDKYPLTRFMDGEQIDFSTSLIKDGVEINVCFIGFGKTNRQIFLTSVANNQFLTSSGGTAVLKPVNYHIFDKTHSENNKILNHSYYRYKHERKDMNPADYLPLPEFPANEYYHLLDINDAQFYSDIKKVVTRSKSDANFIIIAFGADLENADMAHKLAEKRREWGVNFTIFVKSRAVRKEEVFNSCGGCYFIAHELKDVFDIREITGDGIFRMAQMRNEIYDLEYAITHGHGVDVTEEFILRNRAAASRNWYIKKSQLERESSLYCCLSLRSKLNLMGLDYCKKEEEGTALTEEEYLNIYAGGDLPDVYTYPQTVEGKKVVRYTLDFAESRRKTMAVQEHRRWNSFMISKGVIPSTIDQILNERREDDNSRYTNGKNYAVRRHGNLTTFEGLVDFRKLVARRDGCPETETDVIKYDYQLLDDAYWLLTSAGYKIIKKQPVL